MSRAVSATLLAIFLLILASCEGGTGLSTPIVPSPSQGQQNPTVTPTETQSATVEPTAIIVPTPTQEHVDNPDFGFTWYSVQFAVNIREDAGLQSPIIDVLSVGNAVLVYDVQHTADGIRWGFVLDDCRGEMTQAGWSAISGSSRIWLVPGGVCEDRR